MIDVAVSQVHVGDTELKVCLTNSGQHECLNVIFDISLPSGLLWLRGQRRISKRRLLPGETVCEKLRVRAYEPGSYSLTCPNFSYQDHNGRPHNEASFTTEIIVEPAPETPEARISTELQTRALPLDEWTTLRCRLSNLGGIDAEKLELVLSGQVVVDDRSRRFRLDRLPAGASADASFFVRAQDAGGQVPVYFDLTYSGPRQRLRQSGAATVSVGRRRRPEPAGPQSLRGLVKVLFIVANPVDPANPGKRGLRVDEEFRQIQQTIRQGSERDNFHLESRWAVRPPEITQALYDVEPHFVHFAGHGGSDEESIAAEDEYGFAHIVPVDGLVKAFQAAGQSVRCVIVNACRTERLAQSLAATGLCVIGMRQPVRDLSSIRFSIGFYQALAAGHAIERAFDSGVAQLMMTPLGDDARAPFLLCGGQAAPKV